jgi:hypothetical protein
MVRGRSGSEGGWERGDAGVMRARSLALRAAGGGRRGCAGVVGPRGSRRGSGGQVVGRGVRLAGFVAGHHARVAVRVAGLLEGLCPPPFGV